MGSMFSLTTSFYLYSKLFIFLQAFLGQHLNSSRSFCLQPTSNTFPFLYNHRSRSRGETFDAVGGSLNGLSHSIHSFGNCLTAI